MTLGEKIAEKRRVRGMTQEEIAPRIDAFRSFLQSYDFDALFEK